MSHLRKSSAEQVQRTKAGKLTSLTTATKRALFASQTALETNRLSHYRRQQQLYKLPIIKILEMDKLQRAKMNGRPK